MSGEPNLDKRSAFQPPTNPPRMLGDTDVGVILEIAAALPEDAQILEVGPWLGGLTRLLAPHGQVTVADRFIWSAANAESYPDIAAPETSFRPVFEANMAAEGIAVRIVQTTLPQMEWDGSPLDFVVIDAPRDAAGLHGCLRALAQSFRPGARVTVKHGLNPRDFGMGAYLDALIGLGYAQIVPTEQPQWCNIATITVTPSIAELASHEDADLLIATAPVSDTITDPWYGYTLSSFRLAYLAVAAQWRDAFAMLAQMPKRPENLTLWDTLAPLAAQRSDPAWAEQLAVLSELVWIHNDTSLAAGLPAKLHPAVPRRLRAYWQNNAQAPWLCDGLVPEILCDEAASAAIAELADFADQLRGARVFAYGGDCAGLAIAALLAGVARFDGAPLDPAAEDLAPISDLFPHIQFVTEDDDMRAACARADAIILGADPLPGSAMAEEVKNRAKSKDVMVIRTKR